MAENQKIEATEEAIKAHVGKLAGMYGMETDQLLETFQKDKSRMDHIRFQVREDLTFDWLFSIVKKVEKKGKGFSIFNKKS